ncbi:MAG: histidine kinase [Bacteroidetes bacterium]|nr:histidine kinase [Bacteroidota bacterium]
MQLTAIRAQMNPHFIFNVMNSIRNYMQRMIRVPRRNT